jgi:hypothetical protein
MNWPPFERWSVVATKTLTSELIGAMRLPCRCIRPRACAAINLPPALALVAHVRASDSGAANTRFKPASPLILRAMSRVTRARKNQRKRPAIPDDRCVSRMTIVWPQTVR